MSALPDVPRPDSARPLPDVRKEKTTSFRRGMSRKKSVKIPQHEKDPKQALGRGLSRGLSRKRALCDKLVRSRDEPQYGSRAKTGAATLLAKKEALKQYPDLSIQVATSGDYAEEIVFHGVNSIRAEVIDMNGMVVVMRSNMKMLSHTAVERFFEWMPLFAIYVERYMMVEEDFLVKWVESKAETLKGGLRPSARMVLRGKIQKQIEDVNAVQDEFMPHMPAGERLGKLEEAVAGLTRTVVEYAKVTTALLPEVIRANFSKAEVEKARTRIVRHVVGHVGYQDFLAVYTRWMRPGELLEWKTGVLLPCDFKFFAYKTWERDMDGAHYQIAAQYAETLLEEGREATEMNEQSKADFARALATRRDMQPHGEVDDMDVEVTEEREYEGDE